ncbi:hypothetical protein [Streptomyces sp. rh34]|uniref:hypothetical protein n=1 Tax=Streptomyces sp. rh34 TaxID=2034272 RepID=UPI0015CEFB74|nr:hypothetical protein [Streptomyces sp. rh34]
MLQSNGVKVGWKTKTGYTLGVRLKRYRSKWQQGTIDPAELASLESRPPVRR